jgi:hypothetical protein
MPVRRPVPSGTAVKDAPDARPSDADTTESAAVPDRPLRRPAPPSQGGPKRAAPRTRDDADEREAAADEVGPKVEITGGWSTFKNNRARSSKIPTQFKVVEGQKYIIKILDDAPFANIRQHWIERKGKKSFVCLETDCPMCDILGDEPRPLAAFNIVVFTTVEQGGEQFIEPTNMIWEVGGGVGGQLEELASDPASSPLSNFYFKVSKKTGPNGGAPQYSIVPVKDRDLEEDHGFAPLTEEEITYAHAHKFEKDYVRVSTRGEMKGVVEEVV